ncbi:MAG: DUF1552 domain-containing protein [Rhodospirillaceae bacterium]
MTTTLNRRTVLRGTLGGASIVVGLPLLDCFLNANGTAIAATGAPLPVRFGSWFQHLGLNPGMWVPDKVGAGYQHNIQLKVLDQFRARTNIFSGMRYFLDGRPHETHTSSVQICTTGIYGANGPSFDSRIADVVGQRSRFRSLEVSLSGGRQSLSRRSGTAINPSEASPVALYTRIFGEDFRDPNAADFKPDPTIMVRQSVLSAVAVRRQDLVRQLGASDRARVDEYFTAVREMEQKLGQELEKPAPLQACTVPATEAEATPSTVIDDAGKNSKIFANLLAHAMACDQTRVFNVIVGTVGMRKRGSSFTWHTATHEEAVDEKLGYQKEVFSFLSWANSTFAEFLRTLDNLKEGPGSVLDRTVVAWHTDHGDARTHSLENIPVMTVGSGGGRLKTGMHIAAPGDPVTRVALTLQQAMGVAINTWGDRTNKTAKTITEILA